MPLAARKPCRNSTCPNLQPCPSHGTNLQQSRREQDRARAEDKPWRKWYWGRRWREASARYRQANPVCVDPYGTHKGFPVSAQQTDHIEPHRGDEQLFWDESNWQSLCNQCGARKTGEGR